MRIAAVCVMLALHGCALPIPGPRPPAWHDVEPDGLAEGVVYPDLFVVTAGHAYVLDPVTDGGVMRGTPRQAWWFASHGRWIVRAGEAPEDTARRNGWTPDAVAGPVEIPLTGVLHVSALRSRYDWGAYAYGMLAIGGLVALLWIASKT